MQRFSPLLCPATHLETLDTAGVVRRVLRTALHAPVAWPLLREAMAYRCDPVGGPAAAEALADLLGAWLTDGRRIPRLHAPSDPDPAPDEEAAIAVLRALHSGRPKEAAWRLEWVFEPAAAQRGFEYCIAAARNLAAAGLHLASVPVPAPPPAGCVQAVARA